MVKVYEQVSYNKHWIQYGRHSVKIESII